MQQKVISHTTCYISPKPLLKQLHELPVQQRIDYKIALLTFRALQYEYGMPLYIHEFLSAYQPIVALPLCDLPL